MFLKMQKVPDIVSGPCAKSHAIISSSLRALDKLKKGAAPKTPATFGGIELLMPKN
jgi:hypothetical protein